MVMKEWRKAKVYLLGEETEGASRRIDRDVKLVGHWTLITLPFSRPLADCGAESSFYCFILFYF